MSLRPPSGPESVRSLDAEERALAKALPRVHGRAAPGPDLDASILAAAETAVRQARLPYTPIRPRVRWIAPASLAASMVLAVGIAWQLRPLPALESTPSTAQRDAADVAAVQMIERAPYEKPAPTMQMKPAPAQSAPAKRELAASRIVSSQTGSPASEAIASQAPAPLPSPPRPQVYAPPPSPPAPPSPSAVMTAEAPQHAGASVVSSPTSSGNTLDTQAVDRAMRTRTAAPAAASHHGIAQEAATASSDKAGTIGRTQQAARKAMSAAPVIPEVRKEGSMPADAGFVDDPGEDVPPATVDSPAVRDAWLHRIGQLLEQGKRQEAKASLVEFRRRYPAAVLPPLLRALEVQP